MEVPSSKIFTCPRYHLHSCDFLIVLILVLYWVQLAIPCDLLTLRCVLLSVPVDCSLLAVLHDLCLYRVTWRQYILITKHIYAMQEEHLRGLPGLDYCLRPSRCLCPYLPR
jgi:hypothetical protein